MLLKIQKTDYLSNNYNIIKDVSFNKGYIDDDLIKLSLKPKKYFLDKNKVIKILLMQYLKLLLF